MPHKETLIKSFGDAGLYDRGGKKVLRIKDGFVGKERANNFYDELSPSGDVLMIGLAMGLFYQAHEDSINSLTSIEMNQDIIDMYNDENAPGDKHTIIQGDGCDFIADTTDTFDYILFDIEGNVPGKQIKEPTKEFIDCALAKLNTNGTLVINVSNTADTIITEYDGRYSDSGNFVLLESA